MIKILRKLATAMLPVLLCGTLLAGCEEDYKYAKVDDLFQPRFVLEKPEVKANSVTLVWYKVNDAASYTVELYRDQYHTDLFMNLETTDPYVFIDDIPYGTTFYIRVRSNAARTGTGYSKKESQQNAAQMAIKKVKDPTFITTINETKEQQTAIADESETEPDAAPEMEIENMSEENQSVDGEVAMAEVSPESTQSKFPYDDPESPDRVLP